MITFSPRRHWLVHFRHWILLLALFAAGCGGGGSSQAIDSPATAREALDQVLPDVLETVRKAIELPSPKPSAPRAKRQELTKSVACPGGGTITTKLVAGDEGRYDGTSTPSGCVVRRTTVSGTLTGTVTISPGLIAFSASGSLTFSGTYTGTLPLHALVGELRNGLLCFTADLTVRGTRRTVSSGCDDGGAPDGGAPDGGSGGDGGVAQLADCQSLFAARVLEQQLELDPAAPADCAAALRSPVGRLNNRGDKLCQPGESPNGCRDRLYESPPSVSSALPQGCRTQSPVEGCLLGRWLPKCVDGTDGCAQPEAVCQDGTRPMAYMEAAPGGASSRWIFYMGGEGRPCYGRQCWLNYRFGTALGQITYERAMSTLHPDHVTSAAITGSGIMYGDPNGQYNHPLVGYNRVRFNRCSDSASDGVESVPLFDANGTEIGTSQVWHKGFAIWRSLLRSLATTTGRDLDGNGTPDIPSLASATTVLLAAGSDATVWLIHAADALRDELRQIAGAAVDVRLIVDGFFDPMLDNEARYHPSAPAQFNMFDHPYSVTRTCTLPDNADGVANEACSDHGFSALTHGNGGITAKGALVARSSRLDKSCEEKHGAGAPQCYDKLHVLFHHVNTPFLVLADQEDPTIPELAPDHADDPSYRYSGPDPWRRRILDQANDVGRFWHTASREEGPGTPGDAVMVLRKQRRNDQEWATAIHTHLGGDVHLSRRMSQCDEMGNLIASASLAGTLHGWVTGSLPAFLIAEDKASWGGTGNYFVTGPTCREPE